jgi:hypothetical protein
VTGITWKKVIMTSKKATFGGWIIALVLVPFTLQAGWSRTYDNTDDDCGKCVVQTSDGGYAVCAATWGGTWFLKTDSLGDTLWTRVYDELGPGDGNCMCGTSDGGFIITGSRWAGGAESDYILVVLKTDNVGNKLWVKEYDNFLWDCGNSVIENQDGDYIVTGSYGDSDMGMWTDVWLLKLDEKGDTLWTRRWGSPGNDCGTCVQQTQDGGYIVIGDILNIGGTSEDIWLIKTDENGDTLWTRTFGSGYYDYAASVEQTEDGGYFLTGTLKDTSIWLLRTNPLGDTLWTRAYRKGQRNWHPWGSLTDDGGFIVIANAYVYTEGESFDSIWLLKTDSLGDTLWTRTFSDMTSYGRGYYVDQTSDGGYIITGSTILGDDWDRDLWLIKTDENGNIEAVVEKPKTHENLKWEIITSIGDRIALHYTDSPQGFHAAVFDATGRKADEIHSEYASGTITWGAAAPPGVYFIKPISGASSIQKAVLIR